MKLRRVPILLLVVAVSLAGALLLAGASRTAANSEMDVSFSKVSLMVDASAGMTEEHKALAKVWSEQAGTDGPYLGLPFTDTVGRPFTTGSADAFSNWVQNLETTADDSCPDNALQALAVMARLGAAEEPGQATALLLTDGAPYGNRRALVALGNRLVRNDVQLYQMISDWCDGAPLQPRELAFLSLVSGGFAQVGGALGRPGGEAFLTETLEIVTRQALAEDTILLNTGQVQAGAPDDLVFPVDPTLDGITVLGVETDDDDYDPCDYWLTWAVPVAVYAPLEFILRSPAGQIITPGSPEVDVIQAGNATQFHIPVDGPAQVGLWQLRVKGDGRYYARVDADTALHADYRGRHMLPAGRDVTLGMAVSGADEGGDPYNFQNLELGYLQREWVWDPGGGGGSQPEAVDETFIPITSSVKLTRGVYYVGVRGQLAGGAPFLRLDPAPVRVVPFQVQAPPAKQGRTGETVIHTFEVSNEDDTLQSFELDVYSELGWALTDTVPASITVAAGATETVAVTVQIPADAPAGTTETTMLTALSDTAIYANFSDEAETTVQDDDRLFLPLIRHETGGE